MQSYEALNQRSEDSNLKKNIEEYSLSKYGDILGS